MFTARERVQPADGHSTIWMLNDSRQALANKILLTNGEASYNCQKRL